MHSIVTLKLLRIRVISWPVRAFGSHTVMAAAASQFYGGSSIQSFLETSGNYRLVRFVYINEHSLPNYRPDSLRAGFVAYTHKRYTRFFRLRRNTSLGIVRGSSCPFGSSGVFYYDRLTSWSSF